jgi:asparagine synthase (glutamine-hydrolysing)
VCGIAGIVRFDQPAQAFAPRLAAMRARLRHRGPDGEGELCTSHAALAHTRLALVDLHSGSQPIQSPDGRFSLTYNGELYNDPELRSQLDYRFRTRSDAETVLAAWSRWGEECIPRLDGMFAFFIWDELEQAGFAVRDRLGVKPLAYLQDGPELSFASEARALLEGRKARPDVEAIVEYLVAPAFSGVSRSPFRDVRYLPPAHLLRVDASGIRIHRYWQWSPQEGKVTPEELRDAFVNSVHKALRADVPLGIFLSGGLDSTAIAAAAGRSLPSWTVTYEGEAAWNDSLLVVENDTPHARAAARELKLAFNEVPVARADLTHEIAALAAVNDALPAWEQELSQRALSRAAARSVKGVLVGDAADETHYGYHFLLDAPGPAVIFKRLGSVPVRREIDADPIARLDEEYRRIGDFKQPVVGMTQLIVERWLPRLLHNGDIHSMRFGLEARVPFATTRLLELAAQVSPRLALHDGVEKAFLREALRGVLPEAIRTRRKSALPKDQGAQQTYQSELLRLDLHPLVREIVDLKAIKPLLHAPVLKEQERAQLFRVLCLHHWASANEVP